MTATTIERLTPFAGVTASRATLPIAASTKLLKGTIVCQDANGRAAVPSAAGTAGIPAAGIARATYDNSAGDDDAIDAEITVGLVELAYTGDAPKRGEIVYVVDNQTVALSSNDGGGKVRGVAGIVTATSTGKCVVWINAHVVGILVALEALDARVFALENP